MTRRTIGLLALAVYIAAITLDELADTITIKRKSHRYGKTGLRRLLLIDGGEVIQRVEPITDCIEEL